MPLFKKVRIKPNSHLPAQDNTLDQIADNTILLLRGLEFYFEPIELNDFPRDFVYNWANKERCHKTDEEDPMKHSTTDHTDELTHDCGDQRIQGGFPKVQ